VPQKYVSALTGALTRPELEIVRLPREPGFTLGGRCFFGVAVTTFSRRDMAEHLLNVGAAPFQVGRPHFRQVTALHIPLRVSERRHSCSVARWSGVRLTLVARVGSVVFCRLHQRGSGAARGSLSVTELE